jgi:DNA repair protein RadC
MDTSPSREDIIVTKRVKEAGDLMSIKLLDHIIIVKGGYYSFKENNMLD